MIRRPSGSDFLGLTNTLRSLTAPPMASLVQEAHRMARRRLEAGGAIDDRHDPDDFLLPADVAAEDVMKAIQAELRKRGDRLTNAPPLIVRRAGGRAIVPGVHLHRLGGGHHWRGRRFLYAVISAVRGNRGRLGQPRSGRPIAVFRPNR